MSTTRSKVRLEDHLPEVDLTPETRKSAIVAYLYRNDEYGYKPKAVHEELDIPHNTAKTTLRRLKQDKYIAQTEDGYYHARSDREDLYRYVGALDGLDRLFADHDDTEVTSSVADSDTEPTLSEDEIDDAIDVFDDED
jgi:Mn-dependent DtxR family transcriptional regulator